MVVADTEKALTIDANVVNYYFRFINNCSLPKGLRVRMIKEFCVGILDKHPIAINQLIRTEYERVVGLETIKNWLGKRLQNNLAIHVDCLSLPDYVESCLKNDYGFNCRSKDAKYLETCINTILKHFVTENRAHFNLPHRSRRRRPMRIFLRRELGISVSTIDECCAILLKC